MQSAGRMPSSVNRRVGLFDRFAGATTRAVSRAPFFAVAVLLVVAWMVEGIVLVASSGDPGVLLKQTYQLQINTATTIITFLLVALLQNSQARADEAVQEKLNAIADALGDLMSSDSPHDSEALQRDVEELRAAVGLEDVTSSGDDERPDDDR